MKKTALLAAAAALFAVAPTMAHAEGSVGLNYGATEIDAGGGDIDALSADGAFGFGGDSWGVQLDGALGNLEMGPGDSAFLTTGGHVWWGGQGWRLGGVVSYTNIDEASADEFAYGIEGTFDVGANAVLQGSITNGELEDVDLFNWDVGANYYFTPNFRAGATFGTGTIEAGGDLDTQTYGVNAEFQPWSTPVSFTLAWNNYEIDNTVGSDTLALGVRYNFGAGSLRERDNDTPFDTNTGYLNRLYGIY